MKDALSKHQAEAVTLAKGSGKHIMPFAISKLIETALLPSNLVALVGVCGLLALGLGAVGARFGCLPSPQCFWSYSGGVRWELLQSPN